MLFTHATHISLVSLLAQEVRASWLARVLLTHASLVRVLVMFYNSVESNSICQPALSVHEVMELYFMT